MVYYAHMRNKESFISPQFFFVILGIIVVAALGIRFLLPSSSGDSTTAEQQIAYYENLLFNRSTNTNVNATANTPETNVNTNQSAESKEKSDGGYLVAVTVDAYDLLFTTSSQDFTTVFPAKVIASGSAWIPGALWRKPFVIAGKELVMVKPITQDEKVTAQSVIATNLVTGEERELTRVEVETHASQNGDVISSIAYDAENNTLTFVVDRDYSETYEQAGTDFRQDVYAYDLTEDSRSALPIESKNADHRITGVHHVAGETVFDFANGKEKNFRTSIGVLGKKGKIAETETGGRFIFLQEHAQALYYTSETEDDLYAYYVVSKTGERIRDFTSAATWQDRPRVIGDDVPIVYYLETLGTGDDAKEVAYSKPIAGERPSGQVYIGYGRPKAFAGNDILLLGKATDDRQYVSTVYDEFFGVLNMETNTFTELDNPKESVFIGVRKR